MAKRKDKAADRFNGLLVVDKPGRARVSHDAIDQIGNREEDLPTSHDVVQRVRRWSKQRRIGHTGTLDPLASGVLILCLGPSTRLVEYYQGHPKQYYAEVVLGRSTNTYDAFGETVEEKPIPPLTRDQIEAALVQFRGTIQQKPPIFSALKQAGESLHHKARRGETVEVKPRTVTLHTLDLVDFSPSQIQSSRIVLRTTCSAGTYIRSLAHDLGIALGTVAHLDILRREAAGPFSLTDAVPLDALAGAAENDTLHDFLHPPAYRLDLPEIKLTNELITRFGYGQKVVLELSGSLGDVCSDDVLNDDVRSNLAESAIGEAGHEPIIAKAIDPQGVFAGILRLLGYAQHQDNSAGDTSAGDNSAGDSSIDDNSSENEHAEKRATVWKADKWFAT